MPQEGYFGNASTYVGIIVQHNHGIKSLVQILFGSVSGGWKFHECKETQLHVLTFIYQERCEIVYELERERVRGRKRERERERGTDVNVPSSPL